MKKYRYTALLTFIISLMMVVSVVFPTVASAEDSMTSSATQETTNQDTAEQLTTKDTADQLTASSPAFSAEKTVDGVKVKVSADANVFPKGTTMEVKKATLTSEEKKLVEKNQDKNKEVAKQYVFDITMKDAAGSEIEPDTSKGKVHVTFANEFIKNFDANVIHLTDNKAEMLDLKKSNNSIIGETKSFSNYVLQLTVNDSDNKINRTYTIGEEDEINILAILKDAANYGTDSSYTIQNVAPKDPTVFAKYYAIQQKNDNYCYYSQR